MKKIKLKWIQYENFFELWRDQCKATQLIYSIGEKTHCYIGCIGINNGRGGLGQRYQWQYVHRSLAIFAAEESKGQISYAATFDLPENVDGKIIQAAEALVQESFINKFGLENALFEPESILEGYDIDHSDELPLYLRSC